MIYKVLIIEDELPAVKTITSYLRKYFPSLEIAGNTQTIEHTIDFLNNNEVHILFVDIQLKDGHSIAIFDEIDASKYKLIFTTALDDFTMNAFKLKAFGYLLKPINPLDFKEITTRAIKDLSASLELQDDKAIKIPIGNGAVWVRVNEIFRCESDNNYTKFFLKNDEKVYTLSKTLKYVEQELINSKNFFRCHQSHLVNVHYLKSNQIVDNKLILFNGEEVPISRGKKSEFIALMDVD